MLRIGEFAHLGGVTAKTLRNYHRLGIFSPAWVDPSSGYRYYSPAQLPELRRLLALREMGVPLAEISGLVAGGTGLREVLERHRQALEATKSNIERKLRALDIEVERAGAGPDVVIRQVRSQLIAGLVTSIMPGEDIGPLFEELETVVREARARASRPPGALVALRRGDGPFEVEVFVPVTRSVKMGRVVSRRLPAATVAAVIHRGPYDGMPAFRRSLEEWVVAAGYEPGEQVRLVYLQFGADPELALPEAYLTTRSDDYVTEIQLPVRHPDMALDLPV